MIGTAPLARTDAWAARANPAAKLIATLVIAAALLVAIDPVTSGIVLAVELVLLPAGGLRPRALLRLGVPLLVGAVSLGVVNTIIGTGGVWGGLGLSVRLLAIAVPGIVTAASTDPTDLCDALVQRLHLPERFAVGALAALRLLPMLAAEWRTLSLARRARGLEAGRNPLAAVRIFAGKVFALLVRAIRAGTLLATAMDARGFGTGPRGRARTSVFRPGDYALMAGALILVTAAHLVSAGFGTWRVLFTG
ncbi:MAG TPA: energy-coupling factor transporter transmembrane component T [Streptosporangiaceae bacterium]|jgi:energy-coupling factor transport system permease protein